MLSTKILFIFVQCSSIDHLDYTKAIIFKSFLFFSKYAGDSSDENPGSSKNVSSSTRKRGQSKGNVFSKKEEERNAEDNETELAKAGVRNLRNPASRSTLGAPSTSKIRVRFNVFKLYVKDPTIDKKKNYLHSHSWLSQPQTQQRCFSRSCSIT